MIAILGKQRPGPRDRDHQLRLGWGAGAPHDQIDTFEARFGVTLVEGYGLTEAGIPLSNLPSERRVGSCGKALPGYEVQLVDEDDEPVPVGAVGEIVIRPQRANTTMLGYHKMPEETLERFRNLWLHTGDLARMDVDGFFYFVDRAKDAIRRRGENISSQEIEVVLNAHPDVLESAAVPVPSELTDEDVLAVVHPRPGSNPTPEALFAYCEENMPYFWVPRYLRIVDEPLPRTQTNKIEKHKLRAVGPGADAFERKGSSPQPRTEEETGGA
jgi:crotonobetaine/carnitine-CoA ligase